MTTLTTLAIALILEPPPTRVEPVRETLHGVEVVDDYRWLEKLEVDSPEVQAWTTEQNNHTRTVLERLSCRKELSSKLERLMTVGSVSAPSMRENLYFYRKRSGEQNQSVLYVCDGIEGTPRELLDPNQLDEDGLISLDWYVPNHDGSLVAFGLSRAGDEMSTLHVMQTRNGHWLADEIPGKVSLAGWAPDGRAFLYSRLADPADAYSRVIKWHEIGRNERHDPTLLRQEQPSRIPFASLSENGRWMICGLSDGWSRNDLWVVDFDRW
jgi:prolyl oligopeptidase